MKLNTFAIVLVCALAAASQARSEIILSETLTGAQLLSDSRVTFPTRTPQLQGTSLFYDAGTALFEKLLEWALFPENTLDPAAPLTMRILANFTVQQSTSPTYPEDHDPGIGVGGGTLFGGFLAGDNFGGDGSARLYHDLGTVGEGFIFADELFTGAGYPAIGGSLTVESRITVTTATTEIYGAFGSKSGSHTFAEAFDLNAPLKFVFFAHDADERYQLNWLSLEVDDPASAWQRTGGGDWHIGANWLGGIPDSPAAIAYFGGSITAPATINVDAPANVRSITFNNLNSYTIGGSNLLTLHGGPPAGLIRVVMGDHVIAAPVRLNSDRNVTVEADSSLTVSGPISGAAGVGLTKTGPGTLILSGTNSFAGQTSIGGGTLSISADANLGTPPASPVSNQLQLNGGTLRATQTAPLSANRGLEISNAGGTIQVDAGATLSVPSAIMSSGPFNKSGLGVLTLSGPLEINLGTSLNVISGTMLVTGPQSYAASSIVQASGGLLSLGGTPTFGMSASLRVAGGGVDLQSNTGTPQLGLNQAVANLAVSVTEGTLTVLTQQDIKSLLVNESTATTYVNIPNGGLLRIYAGGTAPGDTVSNPIVDAIWTDIVSGYGSGLGGINTHAVNDQNVNGLGIVRELDSLNAKYLGIREMLLGDVNGDDFVDAGDASVLFAHVGQNGTWLTGDTNYDMFIDAGDASVLFAALGRSFNPGFGPAAVPEPAAGLLAALGGLGVIALAWRRSCKA